MADELISVESDRGIIEPTPVTLMLGGRAVDLSAQAPAKLPAGTDRGGTIVTGGSAQTLAPANASRAFLKGQNLSANDLWINETGNPAAANQPSFRIQAGGSFSVSTNRAISIWGATTGQAFAATEG